MNEDINCVTLNWNLAKFCCSSLRYELSIIHRNNGYLFYYKGNGKCKVNIYY